MKNNIVDNIYVLIKEGKTIEERFELLTEIARYQLNILNKADQLKISE